MGDDWSVHPAYYGAWPIPPAKKEDEGPKLQECDDTEATEVLMESVQGKFWSESFHNRVLKLRKAGYRIAKVKE